MKLSVIALATAALAAPASKMVVHESRDATHVGYTKGAAADSNTRVPVRIALKQRNLDNAMDLLLKVSDPNSADYGKHYTEDQVVSTFAPETETVDTVKSWLVASGIPADGIKLSQNKGWLTFETTTGKLETLLDAKYSQYSHPTRKGTYIGTDTYKLPSSVADHVDFVQPAVALGAQDKIQRKLPSVPFWPLDQTLAVSASTCPTKITPTCLRSMYNFSQGTLKDASNDLGIYEEAGEQYIQSDLNSFYAKYASYVPRGTAPKNAPVNQQSGTQDSGEADLDYEMAVPIIYPQGTVNYEVGVPDDALSFFDPLLEALDGSYCNDSGECGKYKSTNVISISYGVDEADFSASYVKRQCNEWMKLGLQGVSVLISSGDSGVASRERECLGSNQDVFVPGVLGGCPYITSVGATQLPAGSSPGDAETAVMDRFSSGGGFSNVNAAPDYQKAALATQHDPGYKSYNTTDGTIPNNGGIYNRAGRGYPDVSANGLYGVVVVNGREGTSGGTSQSAPIFAALINRIINERIKAGKQGPLGFLNPTLYQNPGMFNDITSGDQHLGGPNGDGAPSECGNNGFSAVPGWDPVTGLGTPNYAKLLSVFLKN
ncbi:Peptidase S8/S53, subtilisin/kexin/sedolisin [Cordyceps fumosorosea ARSEF 2679]|uniref:Peptidase S8/S53, subtilisin/kexin/sedolisin n=1 Tax=Cordyceps fumosorosea (strain ARSEF 2679) TaxID=1081104 RepID=A0A167N3N0_CORFA|nr:Peptidase S8/S53, subtilisin/kexin/sedolisin [Cordyceps fumosorosea ARSEF 2679]OAA55092.1 Peptidase S8/S53, subtilisin/kexin/sedolisin [Cordyceps fumosorosea ARSEF 2679]